MSKDLIERFGRTPKGSTSYREVIVRKALRVRFWTIVGGVVLGILGWGALYLTVPGTALGILMGAGIIAGAFGLAIGIGWLIKANQNSNQVIRHVKRMGVIPDE